MKDNKKLPILYVIVRNDLDSMNAGKAEAHSGHASSQFVYQQMMDDDPHEAFEQWIKSAYGFGTQINLYGDIDDMNAVKQIADMNGISCGMVVDPTYPFTPPEHIRNAFLVDYMVRPETTAMWLFGYKDDVNVKRLMKGFDLK